MTRGMPYWPLSIVECAALKSAASTSSMIRRSFRYISDRLKDCCVPSIGLSNSFLSCASLFPSPPANKPKGEEIASPMPLSSTGKRTGITVSLSLTSPSSPRASVPSPADVRLWLARSLCSAITTSALVSPREKCSYMSSTGLFSFADCAVGGTNAACGVQEGNARTCSLPSGSNAAGASGLACPGGGDGDGDGVGGVGRGGWHWREILPAAAVLGLVSMPITPLSDVSTLPGLRCGSGCGGGEERQSYLSSLLVTSGSGGGGG